MPTARELLEQAEALMQRDRAAMLADDIPTLTDSVPDPQTGVSHVVDARPAPSALDDIPMLTDVVDDDETHSIPLSQVLDNELALWKDPLLAPAEPPAPISTEPAPQSAVAEEPIQSSEPAHVAPTDDAPAHAMPEIAVAPAAGVEEPVASAPSAVAPTPADDAERWNALAEDIRMQVLQRIDIFTDTGLKEQLNQRLQPIVDRASADLVTAINQHVGQLLRAYVAEAIEREIEKWRFGQK